MRFLKKIHFAMVSVLAGAAVLPMAAQAQLSFNIGAVSLYKSNGIDQDNRAPKNFIPALQGGVDYDFGNGFYVGNWNSTGKFGKSNFEIDLYGGYRGEISKDLSYDVGFVRYLYPSDASYNGSELYASLTYSILTAKVTRGTSGSIDKWSRLGLSVKQPLTDSLTLTGGVGVRNKSNSNTGAYDYSVGVSYDLGDALTTSATVSGAQTSKAGNNGKARLVVGISKGF
jgi:uncharacterized protein (TIGR02001 family)